MASIESTTSPATPGAPSGQLRAAALIVALGLGLVWVTVPYIPGLLGGAVLYSLSVSSHEWLMRRRIGRGTAAMTIAIVTLLVLLVPGGALLGLILDDVPATLRSLDTGPIMARLRTLRIGPVDVGGQLARAGDTIVSFASREIVGFLGGAARTTLNLVLALLVQYYLLVAAHDVWPRIRRLLPFTPEDSEHLRRRFHDVTSGTMWGVVVVATVQGTLVGIALAVVGVPNALVWGTVTAVASVLPLLGSALVWLPASIGLFLQGETARAIGLALFGALVVGNLDNVLRPIVLRGRAQLHPLTTLVGAFAGVSVFGLLGILLGPLAITWFFELIAIYDKEYGLARGDEPTPASSVAPATVAAAP
ncbi:MAG: AI-2E family transporter [Gemmatimonadaceae bacterium]|jgi:predicted PurR-regulated permease PerM|nr:AI-2E family transporter [Gemmatimonadaceae bacterium]